MVELLHTLGLDLANKLSTGTIVQGTFYCHKSPDNSRELDVEIHYSVKADTDSPAGDTFVQMYKVR
jgi:type I protein arginine methyltransferase